MKTFSHKKVYLITGANGFVGRALCAKMLSDGRQVREAMRKYDPFPPPPVLRNKQRDIVQVGDIGPNTDWTAALKDVDTVIHLAARVHVMTDTAADPIAAFRQVNVAGTECLAQAAASAGVRRFIFLSSVGVNGNMTHHQPFTENDIPAPKDFYSTSKWEAEQVLCRVAVESGFDIVVIRPPLVYGPGVKANFLQLFQAVARGIPLPFAGTDNRRSLIYSGNLVSAITTCVNHSKTGGQTYLVSDGADVSTPELIRKMAAALEQSARLFSFPASALRIMGRLCGKSAATGKLLGSLIVDSTKIRSELNWSPPYTMVAGLKETAEWYLRWKAGKTS